MHLRIEIKSADEINCRLRQALESGKKATNRSEGIVCPLTTGVLISVSWPLAP
jgi:hypothetical protein